MSQSRRDAIYAQVEAKYMHSHSRRIKSYADLTPADDEAILALAEADDEW